MFPPSRKPTSDRAIDRFMFLKKIRFSQKCEEAIKPPALIASSALAGQLRGSTKRLRSGRNNLCSVSRRDPTVRIERVARTRIALQHLDPRLMQKEKPPRASQAALSFVADSMFTIVVEASFSGDLAELRTWWERRLPRWRSRSLCSSCPGQARRRWNWSKRQGRSSLLDRNKSGQGHMLGRG